MIEAERERHRQQVEAKAARRDAAYGKARGVPAVMAKASFDDFEIYDPRIGAAVEVCQNYARHFDLTLSDNFNLSITGIPGTGKTHIASAMVNELTEAGYLAFYVDKPTILRSFREVWSGQKPISETQLIKYYTDPDLLVIDELGPGVGDPAKSLAILFDVIDRRYQMGRPVLQVSNLTQRSLSDFLGSRIERRTMGRNSATLAFDWVPFHKRGAVQ